jgi:hypothetical protein
MKLTSETPIYIKEKFTKTKSLQKKTKKARTKNKNKAKIILKVR